MAKRQCADTGLGECKGPVTYGPDPFAAEVHNDQTKVWMCEEHRVRSAEEA